MKTLFERKAKEGLPPIGDDLDYQKQDANVSRLKLELRKLSDEKTDYVNKQNAYRKTSVQVMADSYLDEANFGTSRSRPDLDVKINDLSLRINALHLAIQQAEKDLKVIVFRLSDITAKDQEASVRLAARTVLRGMLEIQRGNDDIVKIIDERFYAGYVSNFHPVGPSPWPFWGDPKEPASSWGMILDQFVESGYITTSDSHRIQNGYLRLDDE